MPHAHVQLPKAVDLQPADGEIAACCCQARRCWTIAGIVALCSRIRLGAVRAVVERPGKVRVMRFQQNQEQEGKVVQRAEEKQH